MAQNPEVYNWIREFEAKKDDRAAWLALLQQYEGTDSEKNRIIIANQYIFLHPQQGMFYKNHHTFSFSKYTAVFQAALSAITKYWNQFSQ